MGGGSEVGVDEVEGGVEVEVEGGVEVEVEGGVEVEVEAEGGREGAGDG